MCDDYSEEFFLDTSYYSDCCNAPITGEIISNMGICSYCNEWSEVRHSGFDDKPEQSITE
jgi:hypothetical protein